MMNTELLAARRALEELCGGETAVLCAVSGGLDSMCLLHLLSTWGREQGLSVTAAHFNHQLRGAESDRDEAFVQSWCAERNIPFVSKSGDVRAFAAQTGQTVEEAARTLRYQFLEAQRRERSCTFLLTAHHADDNAETMLLNLLRGSGLRGLTGIPETRGQIVRPFLHLTRQELLEYAEKYAIPHVEDSTNADPDAAARNQIRLRVMPILRELNPRAVENMRRTAELLCCDEAALNRMTETLLSHCRPRGDGLCIDVETCLKAERAVLTRGIREMLARVSGHRKDLTAAHVETVCALLDAAQGKAVSLPYGMIAQREAEMLVIVRTQLPLPEKELHLEEPITFGSWQVLLTKCGAGQGIYLPKGAALSVTTWKREDRMRLHGMRGERSLKRLCADRGISPAQRDRLPVFRVNGEPAAVPHVGIDLRFTPQEDAAAYISFHQDSEENIYEK